MSLFLLLLLLLLSLLLLIIINLNFIARTWRNQLTFCIEWRFPPSIYRDMLKMGKSKPWPEALKKLTGSETLDVGALSEYFEPLRKWMVEQRKELGYTGPGWDVDAKAGVSAVLPTLFNTVMGSLIVTVVLFC